MFRQVKYFLSLMCFVSVAFMMYRVIQLESDNLQPKAEICSCRLGDKAVEIRVGGGQQDDSSVKIVTPTKPRLKKAAVATKIRQSEAKKTNIAATVRATIKAPATKKAMSKYDAPVVNATLGDLPPCSKERVRLVGPIVVDQSVPKSEDNIEDEWKEKGWVEMGGAWRPTECQAISKVAIVVPFRDREEQLRIFVRHMHPMLKRQLLDYRIVVIEQAAGETPFNRGILSNVGYKEASKFHDFNCFIFHDIDLLPENDKIHYGCPSTPTHLTVAIDTFNYRLPYPRIFGGATSFRREHFEKINGYSNKYWGWGGEDDDLYRRVEKAGLKLTRANIAVAHYTMVRIFHTSADKNEKRLRYLMTSKKRMPKEGLNSLKYTVLQTVERPHYTKVLVEVNPKDV